MLLFLVGTANIQRLTIGSTISNHKIVNGRNIFSPKRRAERLITATCTAQRRRNKPQAILSGINDFNNTAYTIAATKAKYHMPRVSGSKRSCIFVDNLYDGETDK